MDAHWRATNGQTLLLLLTPPDLLQRLRCPFRVLRATVSWWRARALWSGCISPFMNVRRPGPRRARSPFFGEGDAPLAVFDTHSLHRRILDYCQPKPNTMCTNLYVHLLVLRRRGMSFLISVQRESVCVRSKKPRAYHTHLSPASMQHTPHSGYGNRESPLRRTLR